MRAFPTALRCGPPPSWTSRGPTGRTAGGQPLRRPEGRSHHRCGEARVATPDRLRGPVSRPQTSPDPRPSLHRASATRCGPALPGLPSHVGAGRPAGDRSQRGQPGVRLHRGPEGRARGAHGPGRRTHAPGGAALRGGVDPGDLRALLAAWGLSRFMAWLSVRFTGDLPFWPDFAPRAPTWVFMGVVTLLACLVAGGVPALRATRGAPADGLRTGGRGAGGTVFGRGAFVMSVLQVAFSVALLGGALLAVRGMTLYAGVRSVGVPATHILTAGMYLGRPAGPDSAEAVLDRVGAAVAGIALGDRQRRVRHVRSRSGGSTEARVVLEAAPGEPAQEPRLVLGGRGAPRYFSRRWARRLSWGRMTGALRTWGRGSTRGRGQPGLRAEVPPPQDRNPLGRRVRGVQAVSAPVSRIPRGCGGGAPSVAGDRGSRARPWAQRGRSRDGGRPVRSAHRARLGLSRPLGARRSRDARRTGAAHAGPRGADLLAPPTKPGPRGLENAVALGLFGALLSALGGTAATSPWSAPGRWSRSRCQGGCGRWASA